MYSVENLTVSTPSKFTFPVAYIEGIFNALDNASMCEKFGSPVTINAFLSSSFSDSQSSSTIKMSSTFTSILLFE